MLARGRHFRGPGKIERVCVAAAFDALVVAQQGLLEFRESCLVLVEPAWKDAMPSAKSGGGADRLAHYGTRSHDTRGGKGHVRGADVAARHHQVRDVLA